jgi:hypothetical protein
MNIAERIYEMVKTLPEQTACEVLSFAEELKAKQDNINKSKAKEELLLLMSKIPSSVSLANELIQDRRLEAKTEQLPNNQ